MKKTDLAAIVLFATLGVTVVGLSLASGGSASASDVPQDNMNANANTNSNSNMNHNGNHNMNHNMSLR